MEKIGNKIDRLDIAGCLAVAVATGAAAVVWSGKNSLSVLVGGVMGLANLRLWRGIVQGVLTQQTVSRSKLVGRFFLKILLLVGFVWVVLHSPLAPWGVMAGFGSALIGITVASVFT